MLVIFGHGPCVAATVLLGKIFVLLEGTIPPFIQLAASVGLGSVPTFAHEINAK
jgi:hypothetical protein